MSKQINLFTILTKFLIIVLPFYVFIAVFIGSELWVKNAWIFIKELIIVLLFFSLWFEFIKNKKIPKFDTIDYLIFAYIIYWIFITFFNWLWLKSVVYWGRYDFIFLVVFLIFKQGKQFLSVSVNSLVKLFLISWWFSLLFSIMIKFRLWEQALISFTDYISNWTFNWSIPTYHWLENSWIKRFQWIFDWPNQMAFFLILYSSIMLHYLKKKFEYHIILILILILILVILTYSRSALLWIIIWTWVVFLINIKTIYKKHKKIFINWLLILLIFIWILWFIFNDKVWNILLRTSSTTWHFDRMQIWIDRFIENPLWSWLAESGPAYRSIYPDKQTKADEQYYIPESWFIQQLTEWGIIYFSLFILILIFILNNLYINSKSIFIWLIAILVMNIFLHIFEATYLSVLLFIFVWLLYNKENMKNNMHTLLIKHNKK